MDQEKKQIIIALGTDNKLIPLVAALLKSIEMNSRPSMIKVYLFCDHVSKKNITKLRNSVKLELKFVNITKSLMRRIPDSIGHIPNVTYIRLFMPEVLKEHNKMIYMDIDMLALGNMEKLWDIPMDGNIVLACLNLNYKKMGHEKSGIYDFEALNIDPEAPYFNSGIMVIDIKKWNEEKIGEKVAGVLQNELSKSFMMDQAGLNVVLYNKWKAIDTRWNYPPHISDLTDPPYVIHFNGRKPIFYDYDGKHQDLFFKYLHMTEWKNTGTYGFIRKTFIKLPILLPLYLKKLVKRLIK